ncbi:MAG: hypothetical protein HYS05_13730 [Acidobacteria bacterium]|nr:hypothetical protein [Acidobacteriota bacterium]
MLLLLQDTVVIGTSANRHADEARSKPSTETIEISVNSRQATRESQIAVADFAIQRRGGNCRFCVSQRRRLRALA